MLGLLLVLGPFVRGDEQLTVGSALVALGIGFTWLALASIRFTNQPQRWALRPGIGSMAAGVIVALVPG